MKGKAKQYPQLKQATKRQQLLIKKNKQFQIVANLIECNPNDGLILLNVGLILTNVKKLDTTLNKTELKLLLYCNMVGVEGMTSYEFCKVFNVNAYSTIQYDEFLSSMYSNGLLIRNNNRYFISESGKIELIRIAVSVGKYMKNIFKRITES